MDIPTYEELKKLPKDEYYKWKLFNICGSCFLRFTYNEDCENKISVDYMEDGCLHSLNLPIYSKTTMVENRLYPLNKTNYNKLIKFIEVVREAIKNNIKEE